MRIIILAFSVWLCQAVREEFPEDCPRPRLEQGFLVPDLESYAHGFKVPYGCNKGLKPALETWWGEITCNNGVWSHQPECIDNTSCISSLLHVPNTVPSHNLKPFYKHRDSIIFICANGYEFEGRSTAQCVSGTWRLPVCKRSPYTCDPPPRVSNVIIKKAYQSAFRHGEWVEYVCAEGYKRVGEQYSVCSNGKWSTKMECVKIVCHTPYVQNAELVDDIKTSYNLEETVQFECHRGYEFKGDDYAQCEDGIWKLPECIRVQTAQRESSSGRDTHATLPVSQCGLHPLIENGDVIEHSNGKELKVFCKAYYKLAGHDKVKCVAGNWTKLPVCKPPCKLDKTLIHSDYTDEYLKEGERTKFYCPKAWFKKRYIQCSNGEASYGQCTL